MKKWQVLSKHDYRGNPTLSYSGKPCSLSHMMDVQAAEPHMLLLLRNYRYIGITL